MSKHLLTLDDIISGYAIQGDPILASLLREANQRTDAVLYTVSTKERVFEYASPHCTTLLHYSPYEFIEGGPDFFFSIMPQWAIPEVASVQAACVKRYKDPSFNPGTEFLEEFKTPITSPDGSIIPLVSIVSILLFSTQADVEYCVTLICADNEKTISECRTLLMAVKRRHNIIYQHPPFAVRLYSLNEIYVASRQFNTNITAREAEVLLRIANGLSTEEISTALDISSHTVETHRKNLLVKFDAKNSAELIKKASKQYWIE